MKSDSRSRGRRRGVGSITSYDTKAGTRWRWQLRVPIDPERPELGTKLSGRGGYATMRSADDALQEARRAVREHRHATRDATVGRYAQTWLGGLRLENSTMVGYRKIVRNHIEPYIGEVPLQRLTATRIAKLYRDLLESGYRDGRGERVPGRGLSANSVNKVHVLLGALLDAALDDGLIGMNPARKARTVQAPTGKQVRAASPEIVTFSAEQLRRFLDWDRDELADELHALWATLALTGMRRGEALALRWSDVDLTNRRVSVRRAADYTTRGSTKGTKTGQSRVLDIDDTLAGILRRHRATRGALSLTLVHSSSYVFGNVDGARILNGCGVRKVNGCRAV